MGASAIPLILMTLFWGLVGIVLPIILPKGPNRRISHCRMVQLWGVLMITGLVQDCAGVAVFNPRTEKFSRPRSRSEQEEYCYSQDPHPYHLVASKTSYTFARDHNITHSNLVPEGCSAQQLWHLVRHGTRYPGHSDIEIFVSRLPDLQAQVIQAHQSDQGELCSGDVSLLAEWDVGSLNTSWDNQLAEAGVVEVRNLASRYQAALPSLLCHPFSNHSYTFRYTATERTKASAQAYAEGIFGSSSSVYLPPALNPDPLLKFYDECPKYVKEVDENPEAVKERKLFIQGPKMVEVVTRVSQRLGVPLEYGDVELLYDACRYYQAWNPGLPSAWCAAFTSTDLMVMEYSEDLDQYYTAGYGHPINYQMACPPLSDVFSHFRNVVEEGNGDPKGVFYFTHSKALLTVMSRLGLYRDAQPLTHSMVDAGRQWRTSRHAPFASNLAFTLSSCPSNQWWVSVVEGERVVHVTGCESTLGCTWEEFVHVFTPFLDCNLASICRVDKGDAGPQDESVFFTPAASVPLVVMAMVTTMNTGSAKPVQGPYNHPSMPYEFRYGVRDEYYGSDFGHEEQSDGSSVRGRYYVLLPDGRRQVVSYTADHQRGYIATITYENVGQAGGGNRYG